MSPLTLALDGPLELQTRFLYPFFFEAQKVTEACKALTALAAEGRDGKRLHVWENAQPHAFYEEEMLGHIVRFIFRGSGKKGCVYLRLPGPVASRWFNGVEAVMPDETVVPVRLAPMASVELLLSNYGVGVLSLALSPEVNGLDAKGALAFNYRLSQMRQNTAARLRLPHPAGQAARWAKLPQEHRDRIAPPPAADAPLWQRVGAQGGSFLLGELAEHLLQPLDEFGRQRAQEQFSVYTVARFGDGADFSVPATRNSLARFLSSLSQVEEPTHAGAAGEDLSVANAVLNSRHWVAVGLMGAAHLIADQPAPDDKFNSERMPRVMMKYFTPYLVALLQRGVLQRTTRDATEMVLSPDGWGDSELAAIREGLLEFAVEGYFTEVSYREALHSYYGVAQRGLRTQSAWDYTRMAISDIEARQIAERQVKLAQSTADNVTETKNLQKKMSEHVEVVAHVQKMVEWIEIFLISVYAAHLWHMFASEAKFLRTEEHEWMLPAGVVFFALLAGSIAALFILKPLRLFRKRRA